jgi:hypothetical protein
MSRNEELLASRYGVKSKTNPKRNRILALGGILTMIAIAGYFAAANYSPVSSKDIGFRVVSDWQTEIDFELTKPSDRTAICSFEALDNSFGVVGWKELEFGPSDSQTNRYTVTVNTFKMAVTGLVDSCQLR